MRDARCSEYREYSQTEQQCSHAFWQQPEGTGRFGRISVLLALTILAICFRARVLNCAQIAFRRIRETKSDRLLEFRRERSFDLIERSGILDRREIARVPSL